MLCSNCGDELKVSISAEWEGFSETPAYCPGCSAVVWLDEDHGGKILSSDRIPPYPLGFKIKLINDDHPFFGKTGYVIDKDHDHYRIKVDNTLIWVPSHWVKNFNSI